jgi:hypothetical protein
MWDGRQNRKVPTLFIYRLQHYEKNVITDPLSPSRDETTPKSLELNFPTIHPSFLSVLFPCFLSLLPRPSSVLKTRLMTHFINPPPTYILPNPEVVLN